MSARLFAVCWLLLAGAAAADDEMIMKIVPLRHRLVYEVVPTLRELVAPGGTVTGMNDQVIIRSTPDNLAQLEQVLATLDTRQRQLRITVRQDVAGHSQFREDQLAARVGSGNVAAEIGQPGIGPGANVVIGGGDGALSYSNTSTRDSQDSASTHFVTAIEGTPAFISTGQVVPLPQQSAVLTPYGASIQESLDYQNVGSGFYVTPRLAGDTVHLEIAPFADQLARGGGGALDQHGLSTVASGRLGEWIPLGGAGEAFNEAGGGLAYGTRRQASSVYDVWVMVEVLP